MGLFLLLYITTTDGNSNLLLYYIGLLVFEGLTNWRIPKLLSMARSQSKPAQSNKSLSEKPVTGHIPLDAEQAMRLVIALILVSPIFFSTEALWFIPWFVASMLLLAGLTNICPMVMLFRWLGFK